MNQMEIFKNLEFGSIRVIEENGKYLFCGTDVAAALGYSKPLENPLSIRLFSSLTTKATEKSKKRIKIV